MSAQNVWDEKCLFSPSLICLDMLHLADQVQTLEQNDIKLLHVDILDGHFSPSMPLGFETVKQLRKVTNLAFDCHIMTENVDYCVDELLSIGVEQIVFHLETVKHVDGLLNRIHAAGVRAGVALKPSTSLTSLDYILDKCDAVLLMLINPGYASSAKETQVAYADKKIRDLHEMIKARGLDTKVILDGRISKDNISNYGRELADIFVCGTTCVKRVNMNESLAQLNELRKSILQ